MGLPDPRRSRVVLLGASTFADDRLPDLPVVNRTLDKLADVLTDPGYGIVPRSNCVTLVDEGDLRTLGSRLRLAARQAEDLLLVYYTGHGLIGGKQHELYLALPDSDWAEPEFNALEYDKLRRAVLDSPAATKVIILDCCFSGRAVSGTMTDPVAEVIGQIEVDGTYVLTSAPRDQVALILPGEAYPAFTGRFLRLLESGVTDGPELLTIDDLYRQLLVTMTAEGLPRPQRRTTRTAGLLALTRNRAFGEPVFSPPEAEITGEEGLAPVAGIIDIVDDGIFLRTRNYLPSTEDVRIPTTFGDMLRKGDAVTGAVPRLPEGQQPGLSSLSRLTTVNGLEADDGRRRPAFARLTAIYPTQRLRLEGERSDLTARIIGMVCPIGKGQRGLVFAGPGTDATTILRSMATAIVDNNPEAHVMMVLVNPRPEAVTETRRSVKGEVIAFEFDGPRADRTMTAELAIERAKRLVELGHDVVVFVDSLSRLSRLPGLSNPTLDLFRSARNIENGGSLTIIATVSTSVQGANQEQLILADELQDAANMELHLSSEIARTGVFPPVDIHSSGTSRQELFMAPDELAALSSLRRTLQEKNAQDALSALIGQIRAPR
jgi:transcription termination factor Rho